MQRKLTSRWTIFVKVNLANRSVNSEFLRMISETVAETVFAAMKKTSYNRNSFEFEENELLKNIKYKVFSK